MFGRNRLLSVLFLLAISRMPLQAAPYIEEVDPPVLRRGHTTRVTLRGTDLHQAVGIWLSLPAAPATGSVISTTGGESTLDVTVPADAPLGIHGLRLATRGGLSNVHLFLIDELPINRVQHSTDTSPIDVSLPTTIAAECRKENIDRYRISVQPGQTVAFEAIGSRFGKDYDPLITIRDAGGRIIARRDNDPGLFYDCRFAHTFESAGAYIVEVHDTRYDGHEHWNYVLRMGSFPAANVVIPSAVEPGVSADFILPEFAATQLRSKTATRPGMASFFQEIRLATDSPATWVPVSATDLREHALEVEPNDAPDDAATKATVPGTLNGVINQPGDIDCFAFELTKGQALNFTGVSRHMGSAADLELVLFEPDGREARRIDDVALRVGRQAIQQEARFAWSTRKDGLHWLLVRDISGDGGPSFAYRVDVTEPKPRLTLTSDVARLTVPQASWQPIPLKVTRERFQGPIELELIGAPAGTTLAPTVIPEDATEIVCRLSASPESSTGLSTIRIVGRWTSEDGQQSAEANATVRPMIDRQLINKDRILYSLRDNQLRPPPSVSTRLALMVTPPAPFDVELSEELITLTKYQTAVFPITTSRRSGFDAPLRFTVTGGQIGDERQERDQVFARIPDATVGQKVVNGEFFNRINTRYEKARVDFTATGSIDGHDVTLFRTFDLDVRSAFKPVFEPNVITTQPGGTVTVKLLANRTSTFSGDVTVVPTQTSGLPFPEELLVPEGDADIEFTIPIPSDVSPRRYSLRFESKGYVGRYEEHLREPVLTIDVKQPK